MKYKSLIYALTFFLSIFALSGVNFDKFMKRNKPLKDGFELVEYDIYNLMINYLMEEGYLEDCIDMEKNEGMDYLIEAVNELLMMNDDSNYFAKYIDENTPDKAILFITGVGKIFPFIRSHKILNNLHQLFDRSPVIMFYPGRYDGQSLNLFEEFKDDNYYRAFQLIK